MTSPHDDIDTDHEIEAMQIARAEQRKHGEGLWKAILAQDEINERVEKLARLYIAIQSEPDHPRLSRAREIVAELESELSHWRKAHLAALPVNHNLAN